MQSWIIYLFNKYTNFHNFICNMCVEVFLWTNFSCAKCSNSFLCLAHSVLHKCSAQFVSKQYTFTSVIYMLLFVTQLFYVNLTLQHLVFVTVKKFDIAFFTPAIVVCTDSKQSTFSANCGHKMSVQICDSHRVNVSQCSDVMNNLIWHHYICIVEDNVLSSGFSILLYKFFRSLISFLLHFHYLYL